MASPRGEWSRYGVANGEAAVFGDSNNLRRGITVQVNLETFFDSTQHLFVPLNFQVGMQAALHQHAGAAELDGLANFFVNGVEIEDVSLFRLRPFQRAIKRAKGAILGAEVRVVNVAVDDVSGDALRMQSATDSVGFHADSDQIVGAVEVEGLGVGEGHILGVF